MSILAVLFVAGGALAQSPVTVTGTVTDNYGPVTGAAVILEGTTTGTTSGTDGTFTLRVPDPAAAVLVFKFVGYTDLREPLNGRMADIHVTMVEAANQLEDIVVIGYGTQKRANLTGAVSSVAGETLAKVPAASVAEALVGKLPGVQITSVDGSPDAEIMIRVRGGGSIEQDNKPLILVDGFEVSSLNDIPPTDIASVDVLKDAASTAVYGARGANGVILVTTKRPQEGRISVNINTYMQVKTLAKKLDVMNPYEFVLMQYEYDRQRSSNPTGFINEYGRPEELYIYQGEKGTDWQEEIMGSNPVSKYIDVNLSGGNKQTQYKLSMVHQDLPGVLTGSGMKQSNVNAFLSTKLHDNVRIEFRTRLIDQGLDGVGTEGVSVLDALRYAPTEGLSEFMTLPENNEYFDPDDYEQKRRYNPRENAELNYRKRTTRTFNTTAALSWQIIRGLSFRTEFGYQYQFRENHRFYGVGTSTSNNNGGQPVTEWEEIKSPRWQWTNTLNYDFKYRDLHDFQLMVGQEVKHSESTGKKDRLRYFPVTISGPAAFENQALGVPYESSTSGDSPNRIASFFGRVNYGYADKYLATFTLRADGSTKFGSENRWGYFPAVAVAWRISQEDFMRNKSVVSNLKLRASYGASGNDNIPADSYSKNYKVNRDKAVGWGEEDRYYYGFYRNKMVNPSIKWETTITRNVGVDFGFFRERINGTVEFYWNTVKDLLVNNRIPGHSGFTSIPTNFGQTSNRGIEFSVNAHIIQKEDFTLSANFNIGFNKNKIDKLANGETEWILQSGWAGSELLNTDDYRTRVGSQKGLIYGFVNDGMYTMADFTDDNGNIMFDSGSRTWTLRPDVANSTNLSGAPRPGNAKFKKLTPVNPDDPNTMVIGDNDRQVIGNTNPKASGGFGINATYKGFDLTLFFNYMIDFDVYNANKIRLTSWYRNTRNNFSAEMNSDKRWRNFDNMGNEIRYNPQALAKFNENATIWNPTSIGRPVASTYAIEDGSFLRLNTASLGYTLPQQLTRRIGINRVRVYATGYNLFTITNYSGYDPEVNIENGQTPNIDNNAYPRSRSFTFGLQIGF
ncbi:TonB-dependent receptor [Alistipes sp. OttesenSCG-928-L06]|nr:TonB-dependent receptor [Alistipes sp. OttesenSCG-928-L06]